LTQIDDPFIVQFLERQPSRESRILDQPWARRTGLSRVACPPRQTGGQKDRER